MGEKTIGLLCSQYISPRATLVVSTGWAASIKAVGPRRNNPHNTREKVPPHRVKVDFVIVSIVRTDVYSPLICICTWCTFCVV